MKNEMKMVRRILIATIALLAGPAQAEMVLHIQDKAVVEPGQQVRLGDVATISGAEGQDAETLANTVILSSATDGKTIKAESVLMAVIAQQSNADLMNKLEVSGAAQCVISIGEKPRQMSAARTISDGGGDAMAMRRMDLTEPAAMPAVRAAAIPAPPEQSVVMASVVSRSETPDTLAKMISAKLAEQLQAAPEDLRITFDSIAPELDQQLSPGQKWLFRPMSRAFLGSVQFQAELLEGNHITKKMTVAVNVEQRAMVLVASKPIARGDLLDKDSFTVQETYLDRQMPTLFSRDRDVVGLEAKRDIAPGSMLDQRDFKAQQLVARGDVVTVMFSSGGLRVQVNGRAQENGKLHDTISIRNERTNEIYEAVVIGKGMAVVGGTMDQAQEKLLLENR